MHVPRKLALLCTLLTLGCRKPAYAPPESPLPPNTLLLSQMMRQLSAQPGFTEAFLQEVSGKDGKKGPALITPRLIDELRSLILGRNWSRLDRFPGWTMREINPTVRVAGHFAGKDQKLEEASAVHPGAPLTAAQAQAQTAQYIDLGPYPLDKADTVSLDQPSTLPPFTTQGLITQLGDNVTRGDGPNQLAPEHAHSQRLADILNRLAANRLENTQPFAASLQGHRVPRSSQPHRDERDADSSPGNDVATDPQTLIAALQSSGHNVTVTDSRYFANFTHLHFKGEDVMAPFWVDSQLTIPNAHDRHLLIPVSHAELEWHIRAPKDRPGINADIAYYFGIDGKSEWRTMDTLDQPWVLHRDAHTYTGPQALEATRLAGLLTLAYLHLHAAHPAIPFGGYYAFGVCQDGVSAIEHALTGAVTLFPNTADETFFTDPRDAEINTLFRVIPKDRDGLAPTPERIFGSLPADPGPKGDFAAITIPGLAPDLALTYAAWQRGELAGQHSWRVYLFAAVSIVLLLLGALVFAVSKRDRLPRK